MSKKTPKYVEEKIIKDALSRKFLAQTICENYGISKTTFTNICKRNNIVYDPYISNIFSTIDTEEKAYWIGFIYADGSLTSRANKYDIEVGLKQDDIEHLEKLKLFVGHYLGNISLREKTKSCRYVISNKQIYQDLLQVGIYPNKTNTIKLYDVMKNIPDNLHNHFLRGIFDGDGSLMYITSGDKPRILSGITGNKNTVIQINEYFHNTIGTNYVKCYQISEHGFGIQWGKNDTKKIINYIYENSSIYLDRKFEIAVLCGNA